MNGSKALATEYGIALAFNVYGAVKSRNVPWPATIVRIGIAYGMLGIVAVVSEELAALLGAGFLLALAIQAAGKQGNSGAWTAVFGANPPSWNSTKDTGKPIAGGAVMSNPNFPYWTLELPGKPAVG